MGIEAGFGQPFQEQLAFFRAKLNLPSERWDDVWQSAHDRAFVVAGAMKADLLTDLRGAVDKVIADGIGIEAFRRDFFAIAAQHGWTNYTGAATAAGRAWRTRVIYQTNMQASHAAGRWQQLTDPDLLAVRPFWRYIHNDSVVSPRPLHKHWGDTGLTLRHDHPFWQTHYPPNGWGCRCRIKAVRGPAEGDATAPPEGWDAISAKTGAPAGIDKGWAYAPGARADMPLREMVSDKLITYPPAITKALSYDLSRYVAAHQPASGFAAAVLQDRALKHSAWLGFPGNFEQIDAATGHDLRGYIGLLPAEAPRHVDKAHGHDGAGQRAVHPDDYDRVWQVLTEADRIEPGHATGHGLNAVVAYKTIGGETYRAVYEIRSGKKTRALALVSLLIKTAGDRE